MTEPSTQPPTAEGPQRSTLVAVSIGTVIGIVSVLMVVGDLGLLEAGLILVPIVVGAGVSAVVLLWMKRRGDLD